MTNSMTSSGPDLYFIQSARGSVKIGKSTNPHGRVGTLQTGSPDDLFLRLVLRNLGEEMEDQLHTHYAKHRLKGEWFDSGVLTRFLLYPPTFVTAQALLSADAWVVDGWNTDKAKLVQCKAGHLRSVAFLVWAKDLTTPGNSLSLVTEALASRGADSLGEYHTAGALGIPSLDEMSIELHALDDDIQAMTEQREALHRQYQARIEIEAEWKRHMAM